ncbi:MAG: hypothetical protein ACOYOU_00910 [Kiritimatiellia bacterium]
MNRKILGGMRYGMFRSQDKPRWDMVSAMIKRLQRYQKDGNAEHLVDVANLAELEFVAGNHKGVAAADDGEHVQQKG